MNLYDLRAQNPHRFSMQQSWFLYGDRFMYEQAVPIAPDRINLSPGETPPDNETGKKLPNAATIASMLLEYPDNPISGLYFWTSDTDQHGQRVYIGVNDGRLEIHRHLHLTSRWAIAQWA